VRATARLCKYCDDWHRFDAWPHNCLPPRNLNRSDHPAPYIVSDTLPGGVNGMLGHADGKIYDSKQAYYKSVRAAGCEIVADDPSVRLEALYEREAPYAKVNEAEIRKAYIQARDTLTSDNISDDEMHNMLRAQVPAEEIVPNG
jgi:hypothetical protein